MDDLKVHSVAEQVARYVREMPFRQELAEDERIVEQLIADRAGTSRGPVRDAFSILEKEGLVKRVPRRGTFVTQISQEDIYEIYSLRLALELLAIRSLVDKPIGAPRDELRAICNGMENLIENDPENKIELTELDMEFHHSLVRLSGHSRALHAWENQEAISFLLSVRARSLLDEKKIEFDHQAILDALAQKDSVRAARMIESHLDDSCSLMLQTYKIWHN